MTPEIALGVPTTGTSVDCIPIVGNTGEKVRDALN